jgi:hypothetical protein
MKRVAYIVLSLLLLSACDKLFLDVDGDQADLQGKWQLVPADTVYFNFQKNLFQYQIYLAKDSIKQAYGYYTFEENDSIRLDLLPHFTQFLPGQLDWEVIPGENNADTIRKIFHIDLVNSKKLVLTSGRETLTFQKF